MSPILSRSAAALAIALSLSVAHAATKPTPQNPIQPFEVEGVAHYENGVLTVNGVELELGHNSKFEDWWLNRATLNGRWVKVEGFHQSGRFQVDEVDGENRDNDVELMGWVSDGTLWGYQASDESLDPFNHQWVQLDCTLSQNSHQISQCHLDN
ncbi:hypothetical protein KUV89_12835 [Marinobacter hydrocarbonoclasticus]|nr:hypothetical protein [Marinobacter nauticus]